MQVRVLVLSLDGKERQYYEMTNAQLVELSSRGDWNIQHRQMPDGSIQIMAQPKTDKQYEREHKQALKKEAAYRKSRESK